MPESFQVGASGSPSACHEDFGDDGEFQDCSCLKVTDDERALEVLASGLPLHHGAQLAVDITLRSALSAAGLPSPSAAHVNGAALARARRDTERKYGELPTWSWLVLKPAVDGVRKRATS